MPSYEISIVMPCLNEADTIEGCIKKAFAALRDHNISGEVIVADNGSNDDSAALAEGCGASVVHVPQSPVRSQNGYGRGLMHGIAAAKAPYVLMGDSDASYDFSEVPKFLEKLREGHQLVQGCRMPSGGGTIKPGAMPWSHRWIGNPLFSLLVRKWFKARVTDVNCGMRAFRKDWYESIDQRCTGMEFASEMIIKSGLYNARVAEVPITLSPDGRKKHPPHLKTLRDGWRILRLLFLYSPRWLFWVPGTILILLGIIGYILAMPQWNNRAIRFDVNTLLFSSVFILCGYQSIMYSLMGKAFAINEGLMPEKKSLTWFYNTINLERGLLLGLLLLVAGTGLAVRAFLLWSRVDFGNLEYASIMRITVPAALFVVLGFQTILSSFFASVLGMSKKAEGRER